MCIRDRINARSSKEVIASLTCFNVGKTKEDCLERNCHVCFNKSLVWNEFDNEPITYYQWLSKKKTEKNHKGESKNDQKNKEEVISSKLELQSTFNSQVKNFMQYIACLLYTSRCV